MAARHWGQSRGEERETAVFLFPGSKIEDIHPRNQGLNKTNVLENCFWRPRCFRVHQRGCRKPPLHQCMDWGRRWCMVVCVSVWEEFILFYPFNMNQCRLRWEVNVTTQLTDIFERYPVVWDITKSIYRDRNLIRKFQFWNFQIQFSHISVHFSNMTVNIEIVFNSIFYTRHMQNLQNLR